MFWSTTLHLLIRGIAGFDEGSMLYHIIHIVFSIGILLSYLMSIWSQVIHKSVNLITVSLLSYHLAILWSNILYPVFNTEFHIQVSWYHHAEIHQQRVCYKTSWSYFLNCKAPRPSWKRGKLWLIFKARHIEV